MSDYCDKGIGFVSCGWLEENLEQDNLILLQMGGDQFYPRMHIPGSILVPNMSILTMRQGVPGMLPDVDTLTLLFRRLGITTESCVVACDATGGQDAGRMVWTLACMGFENGKVLDGGVAAWYEERRRMTHEVPMVDSSSFEAKPTIAPLIEMPEVADLSSRTGAADGPVLIDTRSQNEYIGQVLRGPGGHIAGAHHIDWISTLQGPQNPRLKPREELLAQYGAIGLTDPEQEVVVYCQTAHRASQSWVLLRHLGFSKVKLYDGSMAEWMMRGQPLKSGGEP